MTKYILSLDGGGIRGAATAAFLGELEKELKRKKGVSIYEFFDMFAGTSTGGIIAGCLGVLQMKAEEISVLYNYENGNTIMDQSWMDRRLGIVQTQPKYNGRGKRKVLKRYFKEKALNDAQKPTLVTAYDVERRKSMVLKSTCPHRISALQAADATSAAPFYFPTVKVDADSEEYWLIDGGVIANNPAMCAFAEARKLSWKSEDIKILSVGTGKNIRSIDGEESRDYGAVGWITHDFLGIVMDESVVDYQVKTILGQDNYQRVTSDLIGVNDDLDDCSRENIEGLKTLGIKWWSDHSSEVKALLGISEPE